MEARPPRRVVLVTIMCLAHVATINSQVQQQKSEKLDVGSLKVMLRQAHEEVKKNYYDAKFHGLDWDARYRHYNEKMEQATSLGQGLSLVAGFVDGLRDSHTYFQPPQRSARIVYGFQIMMVGDKALIVRVRPGTDAASKVRAGDEVVAYNKYLVTRDSLENMNYYYGVLSPQPSCELVLKDPQGQQRVVKVDAKIKQLEHLAIWGAWREPAAKLTQDYYEMGDVMIWKMSEFDLTDAEVDHMFSIAKKHKALVLDLRQNPGGAVATLDRMVGSVFEQDIKIADRQSRKEQKPQLAKGRGKDAFVGKIVVLVDSMSGSAAELFARVIQLENRGTVVGDRSSGSVMEAKHYVETQGIDTVIVYGFSITDADLIMKDGKSLERVGVIPDDVVLPSTADWAEGKDPALARAAAIAGLNLEPEKAGKLFPYEWAPF